MIVHSLISFLIRFFIPVPPDKGMSPLCKFHSAFTRIILFFICAETTDAFHSPFSTSTSPWFSSGTFQMPGAAPHGYPGFYWFFWYIDLCDKFREEASSPLAYEMQYFKTFTHSSHPHMNTCTGVLILRWEGESRGLLPIWKMNWRSSGDVLLHPLWWG